MKIKKLKIVMSLMLVCTFILAATQVQALTSVDVESEVTKVDYIVGKNIEAGTYKVKPIDPTKDIEISGYIDDSGFEDLPPGVGYGVPVEWVQNIGYVTLTENEYENAVSITNGKLEKIDLNTIPTNIKTTVSNGTYLVGKDIKEGTYKVTTNDYVAEVYLKSSLFIDYYEMYTLQNGYIEITKDVVAVNIYNGTLEKVDITNYPVNIKTKVSDGMYYVGKDIATGIYKVKKTKNIETEDRYYGAQIELNKNDNDYPDYIYGIEKGYIEITENIEYVNLINITLEKVEEIPVNIQTTVSENGAYVVGKDILPGIYKWERTNDISSVEIEKYSDLTYLTQTYYTYDNFGYIEITSTDGVIKINNAKLTKVDLDNIETNIQTKVTDGVYIVGKDILPGTYKFTEAADLLNPYMSAYICKYNKSYIQTGDYYDTTGTAYGSKGYIEITENDYYITVEYAILEKVDLDSIPENIQTKVTDGIYLVGKDITPGVYKVDSKYSMPIYNLLSLDGNEDNREYIYVNKGISFVEITEDMLAIYIDEYTTLEKFDINSIPVNIKTTISEDGAYFVGKDIASGTYKVTSKNDKDASVSVYSGFDNGNETHSFYIKHGYIEIKEDDLYISISNATVTKVDLDNLPVNIKDTVSDGIYIVGKDIAPGTYKMQSIESDYTMSVETYSSLNAIYEYEGPIKYAYYKTGYIEITEEDKFVQVWNGTLTKVDMDNLPVDIKDTVSDGLYVVGKDIAPGTYKMENEDYYNEYYYNGMISTYPTMDISWENTIKEFGARYGYIEITEEDKFVRVESATLTKVDIDNLPIDYKNPLKTGLYIVGKDIEVGTYKIKSIDNEYWSSLRTLSSINTNDTGRNFEVVEDDLIEIYDSDYALYIDNVTIEKVEDIQEPTISEDGTYYVGKDIAPGIYKITSKNGGGAIVDAYSTHTSEEARYSLNNMRGYIEIKEDDSHIAISNAKLTKINLDDIPVDIKDTVSDGMYIVGKDIVPGTYKMQSSQTDNMAVEIYNSIDTIYENRTSYGYYITGYIEIKEQDKIVDVRGGSLTKVDLNNMPVDIKDTVKLGLYMVGVDLAPGVYKMEVSSIYNSKGYVSTYPTLNTSWEDCIKQMYGKYGYIEITDQDKFVEVDCTLTKVDLNNLPTNIQSEVSNGLYIVGKDIAPGTYKITSIEDEDWNELRTLSSINFSDSIQIFEVAEDAIIEIKDTDYALYTENVVLEKVEEEPTPTIPLETATVDAIEDKTYTGTAITPKPIVKVGSTTLVEGTDYTLAYSNNVNVGRATITITGKGNYTGTKVVTFKIVEPEVEEPNDAGYIDFNIDKTVSYDKGTVTVKLIASKPVTDYEIVLTLDNITENITVVNKLAGSNAKVKGNTVTMYMIQLAAQADKTVYPAGTVLAEITYKIPEGYFEANKGFDGTATVVNTCDIRITDNAVNYEYSLTKTVTIKDINVQEILQETLKEITIDNNSVQGIKVSLEQATGMTVRIKNIDGVILEEDSKLGTGTVVEILDASGTVVSSETVSIHGEINGDGEIDFFDAIQMISLVYDTDETFEWNEAVRNAAKFGEEGLPEFFDIINLISYIYG